MNVYVVIKNFVCIGVYTSLGDAIGSVDGPYRRCSDSLRSKGYVRFIDSRFEDFVTISKFEVRKNLGKVRENKNLNRGQSLGDDRVYYDQGS